MRLTSFALLSLFGYFCVARAALAAESYKTCTGTVTTLPRTLSAAGTYCLKTDLSMSSSTGHAITITADNVTLDCNDFMIAGSAGNATKAIGIYTKDHFNAAVLHCGVQGFEHGIFLQATSAGSGGGHVVEDNRIEGNTVTGLRVEGDGSIVRRNLVFDTGGSSISAPAYGIYTSSAVEVSDNTIMGVLAHGGGNGSAFGIYATGAEIGDIARNRLRGIVKDGTGRVTGVAVTGSARGAVRNNDLFGDAASGSVGVSCVASGTRAKANVIDGFSTGLQACGDAGDNDLSP